MPGDMFGGHKWSEGCHRQVAGRDKDAATHPAVHTAGPTAGCLTQNVIGAPVQTTQEHAEPL